MRLYAGSNPKWKAIVSPLEAKASKAFGRVFRGSGRELERICERIVTPRAFYEPEAVNNPPLDARAAVSNEGRIEDWRVGYMLIATELNVINEIVADEIVRRVGGHLGIRPDEFLTRAQLFREQSGVSLDYADAQALSQYENLRQSVMRMVDSQFERFVLEWYNQLRGWRSQAPVIDSAIKSLTSMRYVKNPASGGGIELDASFAEENDLMFAARIKFPEGLRHDAQGRFSGASAIVTEPLFILPHSSSARILVQRPADFEACSYLHEFAHFVEYALSNCPVQAIATLVSYAATGQIPRR